jgi:hypothetical protein
MLENLEQFIRDNAQDLVVNNNQIPNEQNEQVIQAASGSIVDTLKSQLASGNIGDIISSFTQGDGASGVANQATDNFTNKLGALGINMDTAKSIGAALIPMIIAKFFSQSGASAGANAGGGFNLQDILGKVAGGADGKFDFNDVKDILSGGSKSGDGKEQQGGGGLMDKLKDLF